MTVLLIYLTVAATLYHLAARATITHWLWSRYPPSIDSFLQCSACSGTWYTAGVAALGHHALDWRFMPGEPWWSFAVVALVGTTVVPLLAGAQERALRYLGGEGP